MKRLVALGAVLVLALAGCSDKKESGDGGGQSGDDPVAMLTAAKKTIDEAASVHIVLTGRDLPETAQALASGDGVATHAPAFKGKPRSVVAGTIYAPAGSVRLGKLGSYRGAFVGRDVVVSPGAQVRAGSAL